MIANPKAAMAQPAADTPVQSAKPGRRTNARTVQAVAPASFDSLPLWAWKKQRRAIFHPGGNRNRVLCEGCGKALSTFPESIDPEPSFSEDEVNGISLYWCEKCTHRMEERLDREHAAKVAAQLQALRASQRHR